MKELWSIITFSLLLVLSAYGSMPAPHACPAEAQAQEIASPSHIAEAARPEVPANQQNQIATETAKTIFSYFEKNGGQAPGDVLFMAQGPGLSLFFGVDGAAMSFASAAAQEEQSPRYGKISALRRRKDLAASKKNTAVSTLKMKFAGAAAAREAIQGEDELPGKSSYLMGNDPQKWRRGIRHFASVRYRQPYPGTDVIFHANDYGELEFDFLVAPGADYQDIKLQFEGEQALRIDGKGKLVIQAPQASFVQHRPIIYQMRNGSRYPVEGGYKQVAEHTIAFQIGDYDRSSPLIIDPKLVYSTYYGKARDEDTMSLAVDESGRAYVAGTYGPVNWPHIFVARFSSQGKSLEAVAYIGGNCGDYVSQIDLDGNGNVSFTGQTCSGDYPVKNAYQSTPGSVQDDGSCPLTAIVSKLNNALDGYVYSTYLGSQGNNGSGIALDKSGNSYVLGDTLSSDFPTTSGAGLVYSSYLGGTSYDEAGAVAIDRLGNAYIAGTTTSTDFPTKNPYQKKLGGGDDAFLAKISEPIVFLR